MSDTPVAGLYKTRLVKGGPWVPVRLIYGPPEDPDTGEILDRSPRWQCWVRGDMVAYTSVWPSCGRWPISEAEYRYMLDLVAWADVNATADAPEANPRQAIDLNKIPPLF